MSVQNLRNMFSQNNGTVPYNPPGLSYGDKPAVQQPAVLRHNSNGKLPNGFGGQTVSAVSGGGGGGIGRFKTIREEPDGVGQRQRESSAKSPTKNNSFLLSYQSQVANATTAKNAVAPAQAKASANGTAPAAQQSHCKFTPSKFVPSRPSAVTPFSVKPSPPAVPPSAQSSKFAVKSTLAVSPPSPASSSSPVPNGSPATGEGKSGGGGNGPVGDKWRAKYDETESKRKSLLTQSQKLLREKSDTDRVMAKLRLDLETSNEELSQRTLQLSQLRKLSEAMYVEYDKLKKKYELETGTLEKAMERASEWYKQNRELKRRSSALMQKVMSVAPSSIDDLTDDLDGGVGNENDPEMDELRKTVKELTQEVSRLQAELNTIKLQEYEAQEQIVNLTSELEKEHRARERSEQELKELRMKHDNLENVSRKVAKETTVLHQRYKEEKELGAKIRNDANKVKSERDVLARQSQLLMMDAASDEKIMKLLFEVEQLQSALSQERLAHAEQLKDLQEKLESQSESEQIELYEEKLKLTEAELLCSQQRAELAETQLEELRRKTEETKMVVTPPCAGAPPPPPPPPLPMMSVPLPPLLPKGPLPNSRTIKLKTVSSLNPTNGNSNAIQDIENYLGLPPTKNAAGPQVQNGAIDAIISQIKGGRFSLKATDKEKQTVIKKQEPLPVVNEMMNVLGTLRRNPKRRASFKVAPADVAL